MVNDIWTYFPVYNSKKKTTPDYWLKSCLNSGFTLSSGLTIDEDGEINGEGIITFNDESLCSNILEMILINGTFENSVLNGMTTIKKKDNSLTRVPFYQGVKNGLCRVFKCPYDACDFSYEEWNEPNWLSKVMF